MTPYLIEQELKFPGWNRAGVLNNCLWDREEENRHQQRMLCYVNHYFGNTSSFVGKSTSGDFLKRRSIVEEVISRIRDLPGEVDVRICGFPEASLIPVDIDLSAAGDPRFIVYESIERMFAALDDYDWFLNIEDDILIDDTFVTNARTFATTAEINEVWLANRMEVADDGTLSCVDLEALPGWTGLERDYNGQTLGVAHNIHSGLMLLSKEQMRYAAKRVLLSRREKFLGEFMASAYANIHAPFLMWRSKCSPTTHHVIHADNWLRPAPNRSKSSFKELRTRMPWLRTPLRLSAWREWWTGSSAK